LVGIAGGGIALGPGGLLRAGAASAVFVDVDEAALARANPWSLRLALGYHHDVSAL
jgi:hypothetical protein